MKDKILIWINNSFIHFGIAQELQKNLDCELYAICYVDDNAKKFLKSQNLVKFEKIWFYPDHLENKNKKPDLDYLKKFEEKYELNLWKTAFCERLFYKEYNKFYVFSQNEILLILEQACHFFEDILFKTNPDFLMMEMTIHHSDHLLYQMCRNSGIKVMVFRGTRFGYRMILSEELMGIDNFDSKMMTPPKQNYSFDDLQNYIKKFSAFKQIKEMEISVKISKFKKLKSFVHFIFSNNSKYTDHYLNYGKSKLNVLRKANSRKFLKKKKKTKSFIDKNFLKEINSEKPFVFFPLHQEPERVLLVDSPFLTNQIEVIKQLSKALPIEFELFVKEHIVMEKTGWRDISYYEKISEIPNVKLIHPSIHPEEIMKKCSLVATINGTAALEASIYNKPSIIFTKNHTYSKIPSIFQLENIEDLPALIKRALKQKIDLSSISKYFEILDENSFVFDRTGYSVNFNRLFSYSGFLNDPEYSENKMKNFLNDNNDIFSKLSDEHIKKINEFKTKH